MARAMVLVVSDEAIINPEENRGGPIAVEMLAAAGIEVEQEVIASDERTLDARLRALTADVDIIVTVGGTSVRPGHCVPEVTASLARWGRFLELPGIIEEIRRRGAASSMASIVSRGLCGVYEHETSGHRALILNAPSSRGGVRDSVSVLLEVLSHLERDLTGARRR